MTLETPPERAPKPPRDNPWRQVGVALGVVFVIPLAVAVGAFAGLWLDERFGTGPFLTLILTGLGFVGGLREVLRQLRQVTRQ